MDEYTRTRWRTTADRLGLTGAELMHHALTALLEKIGPAKIPSSRKARPQPASGFVGPPAPDNLPDC